MYPRVRLLVVRLPHLRVLRQLKQIWVQLVNQHPNQQQIAKVRQESLANQVQHQPPLQRQPLALNLLNPPPPLRKQAPNLQLLPKDRVEIRRFKNNPLIIKFQVQAPLAVRKPHRFSSRNLLRLGLLSFLNRARPLLEPDRLRRRLKSHQPGLLFNRRKAS
jgi:hypothetical protein